MEESRWKTEHEEEPIICNEKNPKIHVVMYRERFGPFTGFLRIFLPPTPLKDLLVRLCVSPVSRRFQTYELVSCCFANIAATA